jgi:ribosomal protein S18 acetylase RimI-like enzyme
MNFGSFILPDYRGGIDRIEPLLAGWVAEIARPEAPVALLAVIDGGYRINAIADRPRPDIAAAGLAGPRCGFRIALPPHLLDGAEHDLAVLLPDGRNLNLPGAPPRVALGPVRAELIPGSAVDADAVRDLLRRTDAEAGFDPSLVSREAAAHFNSITAPAQGYQFYALVGKRLVGYGRLERSPFDRSGVGVVALTITAAYRRKGLGEALLRALLRAASETGPRQVWLSVRPDNLPAIRLYEKLGFIADANAPSGGWAALGETTMVRRRGWVSI